MMIQNFVWLVGALRDGAAGGDESRGLGFDVCPALVGGWVPGQLDVQVGAVLAGGLRLGYLVEEDA
jgi:hypothetical protein